jgi:hypothetical protein
MTKKSKGDSLPECTFIQPYYGQGHGAKYVPLRMATLEAILDRLDNEATGTYFRFVRKSLSMGNAGRFRNVLGLSAQQWIEKYGASVEAVGRLVDQGGASWEGKDLLLWQWELLASAELGAMGNSDHGKLGAAIRYGREKADLAPAIATPIASRVDQSRVEKNRVKIQQPLEDDYFVNAAIDDLKSEFLFGQPHAEELLMEEIEVHGGGRKGVGIVRKNLKRWTDREITSWRVRPNERN